MSTTTDREAWFRPDIDGLRAVAVVLVVGYHARWPGFSAGLVGVDVFLVISGYVITAMLLREYDATGTVSWPSFFARRVRRLLPASALMVVVVVALAALMAPAWGSPWTIPLAGVAALTSTANVHYWWAWRDGLSPGALGVSEPTPLVHTWTLALEEQFYLVLPLVAIATLWLARGLIARRRTTPRAALLVVTLVLGVASYAWTLAIADDASVGTFYLLPFRAFELCLGVAVALVGREVKPLAARIVLGLVGVALLATVLAVPDHLGGYPGYMVLLPCLGAVALILARPAPLTLAPLVYLGTLSYGWYLWHVPAIELARAWNQAPLTETTVTLLAIGALAPAALSHHVMEGPIRRHAGRAVPTVVAGLSAVLVLSVASAGVGAQAAAEPARIPPVPESCQLHPSDAMPRTGARCEVTDFDPARPTLVLRGDSQAWQLVPALLDEAVSRDVNLVAWVYPDCPPLELSADRAWTFLTSYAKDSPGWNRWADCLVVNGIASADVAALGDGGGVETIAAAAWPAYRRGADPTVLAMFDRATRGLVERTGAALVAPIPALKLTGDTCTRRLWRVSVCDLGRGAADESVADTTAWLGGFGGEVVDLTGAVCDDRTCRVVGEDGVPTYVDPTHLDARRVELLSPYFDDVLDRLDQ